MHHLLNIMPSMATCVNPDMVPAHVSACCQLYLLMVCVHKSQYLYEFVGQACFVNTVDDS